MSDRRRTGGVTFPELLVGLVLVAILVGAVYRVLETNYAVASVQRERLLVRDALRTTADLMVRELREVSPAGGDLVTVEEARVVFRAARAFGIACEGGAPADDAVALTVAYEGRGFEEGDSVHLFVDGDPSVAEDDTWRPAVVVDAEGGGRCGEDGLEAQNVLLASPGLPAVTSAVPPGAVLRGWESIAYAVGAVDGDAYLVRERAGRRTPLAGPLRAEGFRLRYMDASGRSTSRSDSVASMEITIRTRGGGEETPGFASADSLTTSVFLRN